MMLLSNIAVGVVQFLPGVPVVTEVTEVTELYVLSTAHYAITHGNHFNHN